MERTRNNKNKLLLEDESTQKSYISVKQGSLPSTQKPQKNEQFCKNNPMLEEIFTYKDHNNNSILTLRLLGLICLDILEIKGFEDLEKEGDGQKSNKINLQKSNNLNKKRIIKKMKNFKFLENIFGDDEEEMRQELIKIKGSKVSKKRTLDITSVAQENDQNLQ